jgi:hypothetical protein
MIDFSALRKQARAEVIAEMSAELVASGETAKLEKLNKIIASEV